METVATRKPLFHIATIANRLDEYAEMKESFLQAGFGEDVCRYTLLDNSQSNAYEPYSAIRMLLETTPEPYLIVCHQDVRVDQGHGLDQLVQALSALDKVDPAWAIVGNAGGRVKETYLNLIDPNRDHRTGDLPQAVYTLDENLLIIRVERHPFASSQLSGFHLYGTDLCLQAMQHKRNCYVIDFRLRHLSAGNVASAEFANAKQQFEAYWSRHFWICLLRSPCTELSLSRLGFVRNYIAREDIREKITTHMRTYYRLANAANRLRLR